MKKAPLRTPKPIFIDEDVDTIVFSNPVAERRNRVADWTRPAIAFVMAIAAVLVMGAIARSSVTQFLNIGNPDVASSEQAATSSSVEGESDESDSGDADAAASMPIEDNQEQEPQSPPIFSQVEASSVLDGDTQAEHDRYQAENAIDRSMATAWNEGAPGDGVGEWIEVKADRLQHVQGVRICAGFASDEGTYYNNARPAAVTITFDDHTSMDMELDDLFAQYQTLELEEPKDTTSIRVTVTAVYGGNRYSDCCISEVQAY